MSRSTLRSTRTLALGALVLAALVCASMVAMRARAARATTPDAQQEPATTAQQVPLQTPLQASSDHGAPAYRQTLRIWVHADSVRPQVLYAEPGPVAIHAEDETGEDIALIVERVSPGRGAPQRMARVAVTHRGRRVRQELELGAGEYAFYEESRPQYKGTLTVEPSR
ncbi:MAG: hypothetical protein QOE33_504 [Acidobacteriota bacterium]|nr:hypothetical protein [Acidobacteriota bacterium]